MNKSSELLDPSRKTELKEIQNFGLKVSHDSRDVNIYFSDREDVSVYDLMGENQRVSEENEKLKADIKRLASTISKEEVGISRFRSLADYLSELAGGNYNREELAASLKELYTFIQTAEYLEWTDVMAKA